MKPKDNRTPDGIKRKRNPFRYTKSVDYYVTMYQRYLDVISGTSKRKYDIRMAFRRRVSACQGLVAKGTDAIPYALAMLRSKEADAREDGAAILGEIGQDGNIVDQVLQALASETDVIARDSLILALGELKSKAAIPVLADLIRNDATDGDTRWTAVESLGKIV